MEKLKVKLQDLANKRMAYSEKYLNVAKTLLDNNIDYQSVINRAYYSMYHAAHAAVYIQMRLNVTEHKKLITKFKKVLIRVYNDDTLGKLLNDWRMDRNNCDYNPFFEPTKELCKQAITDCEVILETCKNLVEVK